MNNGSKNRKRGGQITLDTLARMVKRGFDGTASKHDIASLRTEVKEDVASLRTELKGDVASLRTELKDDIEILRRETQAEFREVRGEIATLRETVQTLSVSIDKLVKVIIDLREEYAAIKVQLARHERWIQELAKKTGVSLRV